jgi:hypothetical protein
MSKDIVNAQTAEANKGLAELTAMNKKIKIFGNIEWVPIPDDKQL